MPPKQKERKGPSAAAKAQGTPPVSGPQSVAIEDVNKAILATITTLYKLSADWSHIVVPPTCRGLGTNVRIPAGSEILRIDGPIAHALEMFSIASACDNCLTAEADHLGLVSSSEPVELKACVDCGVVKFCSEECRETAWDVFHKYECRTLKMTKDMVVWNASLLLFFRLLIRRARGQIPDSVWTVIKTFDSHIEKMASDDSDRQYVPMIRQTAMEFSRKQPTELPTAITESLDELAELYFRIRNNTNRHTSVPARCFHPAAAMVNHSCVPNAAWVFEGTSMRLRSLQDIELNKEITVSYLDRPENYERRRAELDQEHYFECNCQKCSDHDKSTPSTPRIPQPCFESTRAQLVRLLQSIRTTSVSPVRLATIEQEIQEIVQGATSEGNFVWPIQAYPMYDLLNILATLYTTNHQASAAMRCHLKMNLLWGTRSGLPVYSSLRILPFYQMLLFLRAHGGEIVIKADENVKETSDEENMLLMFLYAHALVVWGVKGYGPDTRLSGELEKMWMREMRRNRKMLEMGKSVEEIREIGKGVQESLCKAAGITSEEDLKSAGDFMDEIMSTIIQSQS